MPKITKKDILDIQSSYEYYLKCFKDNIDDQEQLESFEQETIRDIVVEEYTNSAIAFYAAFLNRSNNINNPISNIENDSFTALKFQLKESFGFTEKQIKSFIDLCKLTDKEVENYYELDEDGIITLAEPDAIEKMGKEEAKKEDNKFTLLDDSNSEISDDLNIINQKNDDLDKSSEFGDLEIKSNSDDKEVENDVYEDLNNSLYSATDSNLEGGRSYKTDMGEFEVVENEIVISDQMILDARQSYQNIKVAFDKDSTKEEIIINANYIKDQIYSINDEKERTSLAMAYYCAMNKNINGKTVAQITGISQKSLDRIMRDNFGFTDNQLSQMVSNVTRESTSLENADADIAIGKNVNYSFTIADMKELYNQTNLQFNDYNEKVSNIKSAIKKARKEGTEAPEFVDKIHTLSFITGMVNDIQPSGKSLKELKDSISKKPKIEVEDFRKLKEESVYNNKKNASAFLIGYTTIAKIADSRNIFSWIFHYGRNRNERMLENQLKESLINNFGFTEGQLKDIRKSVLTGKFNEQMQPIVLESTDDCLEIKRDNPEKSNNEKRINKKLDNLAFDTSEKVKESEITTKQIDINKNKNKDEITINTSKK